MKNIIAILTLLIAQGAYASDKCFVRVIQYDGDETGSYSRTVMEYDIPDNLKEPLNIGLFKTKESSDTFFETRVEVQSLPSRIDNDNVLIMIHFSLSKGNPVFPLQTIYNYLSKGSSQNFAVGTGKRHVMYDVLVSENCIVD